MSDSRTSVVICVPGGSVRTAMAGALRRAGFFEVVGVADNEDDLAALLNVHYPDLVVVDGDLCPDGAEAFVTAAGAGRPVATIELTPEERPRREPGRQRLKHSRLGKDILLGEGLVSQNHVWARLLAIADQLTSTRHTQTASKLDELVKGVRVRARHTGHRPEIVGLATWPLDLAVLVGDAACGQLIARLVASIPVARVPILAHVDGGVDAGAVAGARVAVTTLDSTRPIRRCEGILINAGGSSVRVGGEDLVVDPRGPSSALDLLQSVASLGESGFAVLLSDTDPNVSMGLATVLNAGGLVAALDPDESPSSQAPHAAIAWGLTEMVLTVDELAWVLANAVPRRT